MNIENSVSTYKPKSSRSDFFLLPCPFCGGEEVVYMKYNHAAGERWCVVCMECMAEVDPGWAQEKIKFNPYGTDAANHRISKFNRKSP